jgi:hypothetical protein
MKQAQFEVLATSDFEPDRTRYPKDWASALPIECDSPTASDRVRPDYFGSKFIRIVKPAWA